MSRGGNKKGSAGERRWSLAFFGHALLAQLRSRPWSAQSLSHAWSAGVGSLPLVVVLAVFSGLTLVVTGENSFRRFGAQDLLGVFAAVGGVRELFPVICAVVCGAKISASFAASLANMRVGQQVDALEVMGVDPVHYLIAPRLWAALWTMPVLVLFANAVGLAASYFGAVVQLGVDPGSYWDQLATHVTGYDLGVGLIKGAIMGWIIALVACHEGYRVSGSLGALGVGQATNRAIVSACLACILLNLFLSAMLYPGT